jgi:hypothetical protein
MKTKSDIPNQAGFALVLIRANGTKQAARVAVDPANGCHYCASLNGARLSLPEFIGWEGGK